MSSQRRFAIVGVIAAVVAGVAYMRCGRSSSTRTAGRDATTATTSGVGVAGAARREKLPDPRTLARGSLAGTVRAKGAAPIAGAQVCLW